MAERKLTLVQKNNRKRRQQLFYRRLAKLTEAKEKLAAYEKEYDELIEKEEYYRNEISKLENEDYIAKLAREKYFKSEEGEILFKLP